MRRQRHVSKSDGDVRIVFHGTEFSIPDSFKFLKKLVPWVASQSSVTDPSIQYERRGDDGRRAAPRVADPGRDRAARRYIFLVSGNLGKAGGNGRQSPRLHIMTREFLSSRG